jgi:hypothetical protein
VGYNMKKIDVPTEEFRRALILSILEDSCIAVTSAIGRRLDTVLREFAESWKWEIRRVTIESYNKALDDVLRIGGLTPNQAQTITKLRRVVESLKYAN